MTDTVVIDTDILIDSGRCVPDAISCLQEIIQSNYPAISVVTQTVHGRHVGIYKNARAMPNAKTIIRIAKTLNVSIDYLLLDDFCRTGI